MDLSLKKEIKALLEKYQIRPFKGLGQNFLTDKNVLKKIIEASRCKRDDVVLEIGPGLGVLTQELAKKAGKVIAVEKDPGMCRILEENLEDFDNVKIINEDILAKSLTETGSLLANRDPVSAGYKLVANLPFYIVSPVIRKFLESENPPSEMILMVQKEVSQRICSKPPDMNLLAVSVQFYAEPKILFYVKKSSFWPQPKVDAAIIKIVPRKKYNINKDLFFKVIKAGFSHPRKQLANNLASGLKINKEKINNWLLENNIRPDQRAETLTVEDWINIVKN